MLAWLSALKLSRPVVIGLAIAGLLAVAGIGAWSAFATLRSALADARSAGKAEADAQWRAQIADSNAKVADARAAQAIAVADAEARAAQDRAARAEALTMMEAANAALPDGNSCGLDRDRVRLLRGSPRP